MNYDTVTIAAPVEINGDKGIVGVVVKKVKGNRYKTHRILMPDGLTFKFSDNKDRGYNGTMPSVAGGESLPITSVDTTISQNGPVVKTQKEKFSLKAPVEETKDLIAVHNLSERKFRGVLELGGFSMPSIAVTRANMGHSDFGEISVVFSKDAIDPKKNSKNKVYGGDAWTPMFPTVEYEASEKARTRLRDKFYELEHKFGRKAANPLYSYGNYLENELNDAGGVQGILEREKDNVDMMKLFLLDTGKEVPADVTIEKTTRMSDNEIELYKLLIDRLGENTIRDIAARTGESSFKARARWINEHENDFPSRFGKSDTTGY